MANMTTGDWIKTGSQAGSGFGKAWSNWRTGVATEEALLQAERNARFNASQTRKRAAYEAWRNDVYARRTLGKQRNALGVAGVDLSGTAIDVLAATMQELTLNKEMGISEGLTQESMYLAEAKDAAKAAKQAKKNREFQLFMDYMDTNIDIGKTIASASAGGGG